MIPLSSLNPRSRSGSLGSDGQAPLGVYVHIPFCVRKCYYCDFASGPAPDAIREEYVAALCDEIRISPWRGQQARTVFFGGGTPSELNTEQLRQIVAALEESFDFGRRGTALREAGPVRAPSLVALPPNRQRPPVDPKPAASWQEADPSPQPGQPGTVPLQERASDRGSDPDHPQPCEDEDEDEDENDPNAQGPTPNAEHPEWTIECNPGTITPESLVGMREMGFNRISLGVQSFHDHHLQAIGRIHSAAEAVQAVAWARAAGFRRLSVDLIFCLPGQTLEEWQSDVERALELRPDHLSLYNLTIEEETEFGRRHRLGLLSLPDEDLSADMYEWAIERMAAAGLEQYEVSNFARAGEECRHNQIYWRREPFAGFGLGAASFADGARWVNTRSMQRYLRTARRPEGPERASEERLSPVEACGEAIMLGLRTREGIDLAGTADQYGVDAQRAYGEIVRRLAADGLVAREGQRVTLTRRGVLLANRVCAEFLGSDR